MKISYHGCVLKSYLNCQTFGDYCRVSGPVGVVAVGIGGGGGGDRVERIGVGCQHERGTWCYHQTPPGGT